MGFDVVSTRTHRHRWGPVGAVASGGALGSVSRYGISAVLPTAPGAFAWATLLVNLVGCLLIGALMVVIGARASHRLLRPFLGVGVLGGFTTFSTHVMDATGLAVHGSPGLALVYVVVTLVGALVAVLVGILSARRLLEAR